MILFNDFNKEPEELVRRELAASERVLRSGSFILGTEVRRFESSWAQTCGSAHAIGTGNGMDALEIGLRALGIGPGDEVVAPALTAFPTVLAILRAGALPVLADINEQTGLMDLKSVERCISDRTKALLPVHLFGRILNMEDCQELCRSHEIHLVEDCAQAHLASWNGRQAGTFGDFGAYSFYPTKNLGARGDAGALVTNSPELAALASELRHYGQRESYRHDNAGLNSRLDELQAAILSERLSFLEDWTSRRRDIGEKYCEMILNEQIKLLSKPLQPSSHSYHLFVILSEKRNALMEHLKRNGIVSLIHYPIPIHHQPPCREVRRDPVGLMNAESFAGRCISLPCHPFLTDAEIERIAEVINAFR